MIRLQFFILPFCFLISAPILFGCHRNVSEPAEAAALTGPESFKEHCAVCHGPKGQGIPKMGPKLDRLAIRIPDDTLEYIIRHGRKPMPAFKEMSDAELKGLIAYIKTL